MNKFKAFADKIMNINAPVINVFGDGVPGNVGSSTQGASTSAMDSIYQLRKETAKLGEELAKQDQDKTALADITKKIEGSLMTLGTLSVLSQEQIESFVNELHSF